MSNDGLIIEIIDQSHGDYTKSLNEWYYDPKFQYF